MNITRRNFLRGAATGAAALSAPWVWVKKSFAQSTPGFGAAKHVLILYAGGGLRSAPLFFGDAAFAHNPFGKQTGAGGAQWSPGTVLGTQRFPLFTFGNGDVTLPTVADIAGDITILQGVDHDPNTDRAIQDHTEGDMRVTGPIDEAGLLTIIHKDHPGYLNGSLILPPFDIGLSNMARGQGEFGGYRAIAVQSAEDFRGRSEGSEQVERAAWARQLRGVRDNRYVENRAPHVKPYLTAAKDAKINSKEYAAALRNPALDLLVRGDFELGGVSNAQMLEALGGGQFNAGQWGLQTAFALRLMQLGVPAVGIQRYLYDTHSDERVATAGYQVDAGDLGRQISGIHFLLHRMREADGTSMWDRTLVFIVSEFSRDNYDPETGFNSGGGSDHQGGLSSRNQVWPVFGGPVTSRGRNIGRLDPETLATQGGPAMSVRAVQATILASLGIDASRYVSESPINSMFA